MKTRRYWILISIVICCTSLFVLASGGSPKQQTKPGHSETSTLCGLQAVRTSVMLAKDESEDFAGLNEEVLHQQVDGALKKAGIKILTSPEKRDDAQFVVLVQLAKAGAENPYCAVHVQCGLFQTVRLSRDKRIYTQAQTWPAFGKSSFGIVSLSEVSRLVKEAVAGQLDEFAGDYRAANTGAPTGEKMITGTVRYLDFECGFYGLVADDGERYDPVNLPKEYAKDGMRVRFLVKEKKGMVGIHMWGKIVEIVKIEEL